MKFPSQMNLGNNYHFLHFLFTFCVDLTRLLCTKLSKFHVHGYQLVENTVNEGKANGLFSYTAY